MVMHDPSIPSSVVQCSEISTMKRAIMSPGITKRSLYLQAQVLSISVEVIRPAGSSLKSNCLNPAQDTWLLERVCIISH